MTFLTVYLIALACILGLMTLLWVVSLKLKNASIVDSFWGTGFVITAWIYFLLTPGGLLARKLLIYGLVTVWGLRLSLHILQRSLGKPEDFRYRQMRAAAGSKWWWLSLIKVFLLQGFLLWLISIPLLAAQAGRGTGFLNALDLLGAAVWLVGFFFEAVGDAQLARFKADRANRGKVLDSGVWRYTRHPNYFGDAAQWSGFYLIAAAAGGWWTVFSPALMTWLLVRVSGVALLEKTLETRPAYRDYMERTSPFIPWVPKEKV